MLNNPASFKVLILRLKINMSDDFFYSGDTYVLCGTCLERYADDYHSFASPMTVERMTVAANAFHATNVPKMTAAKNKMLVTVIQEEANQSN
jgi:hypothetical protein